MPTPSPLETDREALVALYNATGGRNWSRNDNWLSNKPIKEWAGVQTDASGRVVALNLSANRLVGEIPVELGNLASLILLLFGGNQLSGEIPAELVNLTNLVMLDLNKNQLSGEIPVELVNLPNLANLVINERWLRPGRWSKCYQVSDCPEYADGSRSLPRGGSRPVKWCKSASSC